RGAAGCRLAAGRPPPARARFGLALGGSAFRGLLRRGGVVVCCCAVLVVMDGGRARHGRARWRFATGVGREVLVAFERGGAVAEISLRGSRGRCGRLVRARRRFGTAPLPRVRTRPPASPPPRHAPCRSRCILKMPSRAPTCMSSVSVRKPYLVSSKSGSTERSACARWRTEVGRQI